MVVLRGRFARTQKRLCRNRLWKSGAGALKDSPVKALFKPIRCWPKESAGWLLKRRAALELAAVGGLRGSSEEVGIGHLAPGGFACSTPLAESAICWRAETRCAQTKQHAGRK